MRHARPLCLAIVAVLVSGPVSAAEPKELAAIRARYQETLKLLPEKAHVLSMKARAPWGPTKLTLVGNDARTETPTGYKLLFLRREETVGPHVSEFLFDEAGELLFQLDSGIPGSGRAVDRRFYFNKGELIWVVEGKNSFGPPLPDYELQAKGVLQTGRVLHESYRQLWQFGKQLKLCAEP